MKARLKKALSLSLRESALLCILISVALGASVFFLHNSVKNEMRENSHMMQLINLSEDLSTSINFLSHEARSYVQNRDEKRLTNYWNIINVNKTREKIIQNMTKLGMTPIEYTFVQKIKNISNVLNLEETRAMRLVDEAAGIPKSMMQSDVANYTLEEDDQKLTDDQKMNLGRKVLFRDWYENELDQIKKPTLQFQKLVRSRFKLKMENYRAQSTFAVFILVALSIAIPVLLVFDIAKRRSAERRLTEANEELVQNHHKLLEALAELKRTHEDLKHAQSELLQAEKFATIGRLAGIISHEFRNELGVMRNAAYFLKMKWKGADEKITNHLDLLEERIQETDRIIENIMTFAKTGQPQLEPVDLGSLIWTSIGRVKIPKNIHVHTELSPNLPKILADEVQMARVFVNVFLNAIQALGEKEGGIWVRASMEDNHVRVLFEDNGPGIKPEDLKHLFEPLFTTKARGAGLGLATAQLLIEGHGGTINIESERGKGTVVGIEFPFGLAQEVKHDAA
ncbi:MAG: hypothetical protein HZC17_07545 [Candidatus Omnitrophica bacterium]|nr:hypothetical protein [Candidatus Omnitrophota bacterium]